MPTINQLVKSGRKRSTYKSKSPALGYNYNTLKNNMYTATLHKKEEFVHLLRQLHLRSLTQLLER